MLFGTWSGKGVRSRIEYRALGILRNSIKKGVVAMNKVIFSILFIFITITMVNKNASAESEVGRYQLFQGTYVFTSQEPGSKGSNEKPAVFWIDTATGVVYEYISGLDKDGKLISFWAPTIKAIDAGESE